MPRQLETTLDAVRRHNVAGSLYLPRNAKEQRALRRLAAAGVVALQAPAGASLGGWYRLLRGESEERALAALVTPQTQAVAS